MSGIKGKSGRRPNGEVKLRIRLSLDPGQDADLIQFFQSLPLYCRGNAIKAALRGGLAHGHKVIVEQEARVAELAAQERAEINAGLMGMGSEFDE